MSKHRFQCQVFLKSQGDVVDADGTSKFFFEGYASTPDVDRESDIVDESFLKKIAQQLANAPIHLYHDIRRPVGKVVESKFVDGKGVWIKGYISSAEPEVRIKVKEGILSGLSISGYLEKFEIQRMGEKEVRRLLDGEVTEVSLCTIPANPNARVESAYWAKMFDPDKTDGSRKEVKVDEPSQVSDDLSKGGNGMGIKELLKEACSLLGDLKVDDSCKDKYEQLKTLVCEKMTAAVESGYPYPQPQADKKSEDSKDFDLIKQEVETLRQGFDEIKKSLEEFVSKAAAVDEALQKVQGLEQEVNGLKETVEGLSEALAGVVEAIKEMSQ